MKNLSNKFSHHLKNTLYKAEKIAQNENSEKLTVKHLILALAQERGSIGYELLSQLKSTQDPNSPANHQQTVINKETLINHKSEYQTKPILTARVLNIIQQAVVVAFKNKHKYVGTEHLIYALAKDPTNFRHNDFRLSKQDMHQLRQKVMIVLKGTSKFPELTNYFSSMKGGPMPPFADNQLDVFLEKETADTALETFAIDLTSQDKQKDIDPVIARETEISRLIQILSRRNKNNPVLLGDPGVGKTAIVEGLAKKIAEGNVPPVLQNKKIMSLDLGSLVAGTMYRGDFENRVKNLIGEVAQNQDLILFIDEIHTIIGTGSASGSLDAANLLKPALAKGKIRCIGATTLEEYKKTIETDAALERRFQPIIVDEPDLQTTKKIINGIAPFYEDFHRVKITAEAVDAAARLSDKYLQDKFFPDKAIDLIDEAAAKFKVKKTDNEMYKKLNNLQKELELLNQNKEKALIKENYELAIQLKNKQQIVKNKIELMQKYLAKNEGKYWGEITAENIAEVLTQRTGIPAQKLLDQEKNRLQSLQAELNKVIIGQEKAIEAITDAITRSRLGIGDPYKPIASFIFLGPSGVGKTETVKQLANIFYEDKNALIKIDMSEFAEKFNISKLIGSPAGYVGYREGNKFTDLVKKRPYSIVLFDEIEKADPEVFNLLLQVLEDGYLTDAVGRRINFRNTIIIMTSNIGLNEFNQHQKIGFGQKDAQQNFEDLKEKINDTLEKSFRPEFLNRLDEIIFFEPLSQESLEQIAELELKKLSERIFEQHRLQLDFDKQVINQLIKNADNKSLNARDIKRNVKKILEAPLSKHLLNQPTNDKITFSILNKRIILK